MPAKYTWLTNPTWLKDLVMPPAVGIMEASWLVAMITILLPLRGQAEPGSSVPGWLLVALLPFSIWLARGVLDDERPLRQSQAIVSGVGLIIVLLILWASFFLGEYAPWDLHWLGRVLSALGNLSQQLSPVATSLLACIYIWWRGINLGSTRLSYGYVFDAFRRGAIAWVIALVVLIVTHADTSPVGDLLLLFFATGLAALSLAALEDASQSVKGSNAVRMDRDWIATVVTSVVVILAASLLLSAILNPAVLGQGITILEPLVNLIALILRWLLLAVAFIIALLLEPLINWLRDWIARHPPPPNQQTPAAGDFQKQLKDSLDTATLDPQMVAVARVLAIILIVIIVFAIFAWALRQYRSQNEDGIEEERNTIFSRSLLAAQLAAMLAALRRRFARAPSPFLDLLGNDPRLTIRREYQRLLTLTTTWGIGRSATLTPREYAPTVAGYVPPATDAVEELTAFYESARYDPHPLPDKAAEQAQKAREKIEKQGTGNQIKDLHNQQ
ncbi:MAG: DUF4129 domain-containing protein [Chloroflexi bacterium]|nr:DUF4129 domain-containing protein [Chloroflexota bacterium]